MNPKRHLPARIILAAAAGLVATAVGASLAFARTSTKPIGDGVVVIDTNLAYQGSAAAGTGIVLTSAGEVLTNNHVIAGATTVTVSIPGTGRRYAAQVLGYDRTRDIALLRLKGASNLKTLTLAGAAKLRIGQAVTAVGNAGGAGTFTAADGVVTGLGKAITASDDQGGSEQLAGLIETNAGVQPGDSGGPLLDRTGRVIGMDTAASTGFGFQATAASDAYAIPIARAVSVARSIESGKATATIHVGPTAFFGVEVQPVDSGGFGSTPTPGALIAGVVDGGPSATAGLAAGDVITAIDGRAISSPTDVSAIVLTLKPGAKVSVAYTDEQGASATTTVTLGSGPPQ